MPCHEFSSICQNEVIDLTVELFSYVCHDVEIEPDLQPLNNKTFQYKTSNTQDGARLDISMNDFLDSCFEKCFTKISDFNVVAVNLAFNLNKNLQKRELISHVSTKWSTLPSHLQCYL